MKRIWLIISLVLLLAVPCFAAQSVKLVDDNDVNIDSRGFSSYTIEPDIASTGITVVPTSVIIPGTHKILGYLTQYVTGGDMTTSLWDDSSAVRSHNIFLNEAEQSTTNFQPVWFPYPRPLLYGLVVYNSDCRVVIFYTK